MIWRRGTTKATDPAVELSTAEDLGSKGRPTPSRREAEAERKERLKATARGENSGKGRAASTARSTTRSNTRAERNDVRKRVLEGDERVLSARDRGPERRFARDWVDSRHTVGEYFLYAAFAILFLGFIRIPITQLLSQVLLLAIILGLAINSFRIYRGVDRAVREKFPNGNVDGVARYATMRAMSLRRMRVPKPQVTRARRGSKNA